MSRIIISDVHGCMKTFKALIKQLPKGVPITIAGDLVDRGKDSRKVVEYIIKKGYDCVMGNHEEMMVNDLHFSEDGKLKIDYYHSDWVYNGGLQTLASYDIKVKEEMENGEIVESTQLDLPVLLSHLEWMKTLPTYILYDELNDKGEKLLVTHSTAASVWHLVDEADEYDKKDFKAHVLWDRVHLPKKIKGIFNVYGHTPQEGKATVKEHFACIDTGAYFKKGRYGKMTALQWPEMIVYEQENVE